jgi:uncharacterized protein YdeI (YjbR/CyaY-like superfamily)
LEKLRGIILECPLSEELKWGKPCYTYQDSNIALIHEFKDYCAILFHKGSLLKDPEGILVQQTENVHAARQIRFTNVQQVIDLEPVIKSYIDEAIEVEKAGLKVVFPKATELIFPEEFQTHLDESPDLKAAFEALTPGRQKGYHLHFSAPKQSKTRVSRVKKCIPMILEGKGLNDR